LTKPVPYITISLLVIPFITLVKISKKFITWFRIALGILLLSTLVYLCDPHKTWLIIKQASPLHLAGALLLYLASMPLVAWRWQLVLKAKSIVIGLWSLTKYYLIGFFFNNFLPSSIGGDITRVVNTTSHGYSYSDSFACVFVERLIGFLAMATLAIGSLFFLAHRLQDSKIIVGSTVCLAVLFAIMTFCCFHPLGARLVETLLAKIHWEKPRAILQRLYSVIHSYREHKKTIWLIFIISLVYQFVLGVFVYWVFRATGLDVPFWFVFALMQISSMAGVLPITLESMGIRESIFVLGFASLGYDNAAVILAPVILVRVLSIIGSSAGGVFLLRGDMHLLNNSKETP
jgi:uncharacterized protein (TIRG00374 family)